MNNVSPSPAEQFQQHLAAAQEHLEAAAGVYRAQALSTLDFWRQVPLLHVLTLPLLLAPFDPDPADVTRSGCQGVTHESVTPLSVRCWDGMLVGPSTSTGTIRPATALEVVTATSTGEILAGLDGREFCEALVAVGKDTYWATDAAWRRPALDRQHMDAISRYRLGFHAGWETMAGPVHEASEALAGLAEDWGGSLAELLQASVALLDEPSAVVENALVFQVVDLDPREVFSLHS